MSWDNPILSMTEEQLDNAAKSIKNPKAIIALFLFSIWPILLTAYSSVILYISREIIGLVVQEK